MPPRVEGTYVTQPYITQPPLTTTTAQKIVDMQKNIVDNLNILLSRQQIMTSDISDTMIESFENMSQGSVNQGSIMLNPENYPAVSDYANIYNQNIALLDDPRNMINASFNTYINIQDKKINKLRTKLNQLQNDIQNNKISAVEIQGFKSMNNSQILNVEAYNDPKYSPITTQYNPTTTQYNPTTTQNNTTTTQYNPTTTQHNTTTTQYNPTTTKPINYNVKINGASQYPNYLIYGNNGCLQYESSTTDINNKVIPATWSFQSCNATEPRQQFVSTQVNDLPIYNSFIRDPNNITSRLNSTKTTTFGFNVLNPINNQDQCLQLNNDGLSVMPCHLDFEQRFRPIYSTVLP